MTAPDERPGERGQRVSLAACPIGLFLADSGELCLKTEYGNNEGRIDAYIVSSGEFFWGADPQTIANQRAQMVQPFDSRATIADLTAEIERLREALAEIAEGKGAFNRDPLQHATNTIRDMIDLANRALAPAEAESEGKVTISKEKPS